LSLLLCLPTVVLWGSRIAKTHSVVFKSGAAADQFIATKHCWYFVHDTLYDQMHSGWINGREPPWWQRWHYEQGDISDWGDEFRYVYDKRFHDFVIAVPYCYICPITALVPAAWLTVRLRRQRIPRGHCPICRYDLSATSARCPECGHVPTEAPGEEAATTENTEEE
jgi:hypothetical protein